MGKRSAAGLLTSVDSIFTTQEERDNAQRSYVTDLSAAEISDFPNHPFKVRMDQSMVELADSVKQYGVLVPSLVRPMPDGSYQMVSGHRRKRAAELAGLPTVPCIIRELTDDEAIIVMVDSNLQREQILPSEKAFAYQEDIRGKVVVIRPEVLRREYRHATCQLQLCTSGSGAYPNSRGTACYCTELYSGQRARFERSDILGVIAPEDLPKWAKHYLELRQAEKERNSRDREGR